MRMTIRCSRRTECRRHEPTRRLRRTCRTRCTCRRTFLRGWDCGKALKRAMKKTAYKGIASESRTGPDAMVGVKWGDATSQSPETVTLDFKLQKSGNHWKVVAIPNLTKVTK